MRGRVIVVLGLAVLVAASFGIAGEAAEGPSKHRQKLTHAKAFRSCQGLVRYARRHALRTVEPRRLISPAPIGVPAPALLPVPEKRAVGPIADAAPAPGYSETNVQEAGVDEPDIVKTDGSRVFAVAAGKLHAVDVTGATPRLVGSLALDQVSDHQLLLRGDRLLVVSSAYAGGIEPLSVRGATVLPAGGTKTVIAEVDVHRPEAMRVVRTLTVDGTFVSSRLHGSTARLVIASHPRALEPPPVPVAESRSASRRDARKRLRRARLTRWLPSYVLRKGRAGRRVKRTLVRCSSVRHAPSFSGLDLLTVLTIDLDKGLPPIDSDGLMTDAQIVYASQRNLYVTTQRWVDPSFADQPASGTSTVIHKFAAPGADSTVYRASGEVPGFLLNQFSLSEHEGFLRVASTEQPVWLPDLAEGGRRQSESFVTVLDERGDRLVPVGRVGGLGHGERIYSVRFIDEVGYVVTFRQVDPLYTVDLSSPAQPKVLGELELRGYSAYLHPVGKDLLIGVGQDATELGRTLGTQISLFDVSDLRRPVRLHRRTIAQDSSSEVEYDHHAFLYWPATQLAVMPVQVYGEGTKPFSGAIGFRIARESGIAEVGRVSHDPDAFGPGVRRALVIGDRLFTISERGVKQSRLDNLAELGWVPFG